MRLAWLYLLSRTLSSMYWTKTIVWANQLGPAVRLALRHPPVRRDLCLFQLDFIPSFTYNHWYEYLWRCWNTSTYVDMAFGKSLKQRSKSVLISLDRIGWILPLKPDQPVWTVIHLWAFLSFIKHDLQPMSTLETSLMIARSIWDRTSRSISRIPILSWPSRTLSHSWTSIL